MSCSLGLLHCGLLYLHGLRAFFFSLFLPVGCVSLVTQHAYHCHAALLNGPHFVTEHLSTWDFIAKTTNIQQLSNSQDWVCHTFGAIWLVVTGQRALWLVVRQYMSHGMSQTVTHSELGLGHQLILLTWSVSLSWLLDSILFKHLLTTECGLMPFDIDILLYIWVCNYVCRLWQPIGLVLFAYLISH